MILRAVLIDDEDSGRESLRGMLERFCPNVTVVATADNPKTGIEVIKLHSPDVVFLDVEMPGGTGFTVLEAFSVVTFHVIFVTAYQHYAMKAIKFSALDYLLKPVDMQELQNAIAKIENPEHKSRSQVISSSSSKFHSDSIALPSEDGLLFIDPAEILRCESDSNYTTCFLMNGTKLLISRTLKEFEELLSHHNFMRVHKSHLINLRGVVRYIRGKGGVAVMTDKAEIEVSPKKRDEFLKSFDSL